MSRQKPRAEPYHHGNLRSALLEQASRTLREGGGESLSLRGLARELGVSQTAPYRHFADRESLLVALATQGFQELTARMREARGPEPLSLSAALQAIGNAYVTFARENSELFRLMFGLFLPRTEGRYPDLKAAADEAHGELLETIRRAVDESVSEGPSPEELAAVAWSTAHGLSFLAIDGLLSGRGFSADLSLSVARVTEIGATAIARTLAPASALEGDTDAETSVPSGRQIPPGKRKPRRDPG